MKVEFKKTGTERKALVTAISEILQRKPRYMGMPSAAYDFEWFKVDKKGNLEFAEDVSKSDINKLLNSLKDKGFNALDYELSSEEKQCLQRENLGLTVAISRDKVDLYKLEKILKNKGDLIKQALGITSLEIEYDEEKVCFPWFDEMDNEHAMTYTKFISALCQMSIENKRINDSSKKVVNEKYTFRCFLLRLGFIGDEFKKDRKILLENLSGSSAFRNGGYEDEISK